MAAATIWTTTLPPVKNNDSTLESQSMQLTATSSKDKPEKSDDKVIENKENVIKYLFVGKQFTVLIPTSIMQTYFFT